MSQVSRYEDESKTKELERKGNFFEKSRFLLFALYLNVGSLEAAIVKEILPNCFHVIPNKFAIALCSASHQVFSVEAAGKDLYSD